MKLENQVAIVTGGAKGIGRAVVELFVREGASVVIADCDPAGAELAAELTGAGHAVVFVHCDVSREEEVKHALAYTVQHFGALDLLINDAAWQLNKPLLETSAEEFRRVLDINLTGTFLFLREAAAYWKAHHRPGAVVNFGSTFALVGSPGYLAYHASKGAIVAMTRAAAVALMPDRIRVNAVSPGTTDTPGLHDGARDTGDEEQGLQRFLALQPLQRFGQPGEIAQAVLFLASAEASFVTGSNLVVDGGYTIV